MHTSYGPAVATFGSFAIIFKMLSAALLYVYLTRDLGASVFQSLAAAPDAAAGAPLDEGKGGYPGAAALAEPALDAPSAGFQAGSYQSS